MAGRLAIGLSVLAIVATFRTLLLSRSGTGFLAPLGTAPHNAATKLVPRTPVGPVANGSWEAADAPSGASLGAASVAAALLCAAFRARSGRSSSITRRCTIGRRDIQKLIDKMGLHVKNHPTRHYPGEYGYRDDKVPKQPTPPPARMALHAVEEPSAVFNPSDFYTAARVKLDPASVQKSVPEGLPAFINPKKGVYLQKERGAKRRPTETEAYFDYAEEKLCTLGPVAEKMGTTSDIIADRGVLLTLLNFLDGKMAKQLKWKSQRPLPVDLVKVTKKGKALMLELLFDAITLRVEHLPYNGSWKRSEYSEHGECMPALRRLCTSPTWERTMTVTGIWEIKGGEEVPKPSDLLSEFKLGDLSISTRAPVDATLDGKSIEIKSKNFYKRQDITKYETYMRLLLGGTDMLSLTIQRNGKVCRHLPLTLESLTEGDSSALIDAVELRLGRLTALLQKVKATMEEGDKTGPYVLQMQGDDVVLGPYEVPPPEPEEEEVEEAEEMMA